MLTTWLDGLKHVEAVEADPRVCYDSCCFQKMVLRKHWSIAIPRNPNIIPQNQKIKRHQKTKTVLPQPPTVRRSVSHFRSSAWDSALAPLDMAWQHGLPWQNMSDGNCGNCGNCHNLRCLWSHGPRHLDDFAESFLMSAFRNGSLRTMKAQIRKRHWTSWTADMRCYVMLCDVMWCYVMWCYVMLCYVFIELRIQFWWGWRHFLLKWKAGRPSSSRCFCRPTML